MEQVVGVSVNALVLAAMYILVALGFALLFSIMNILNFAHGAIYMVGGYLCYQFVVGLGLNHWLSLFLTVIIVALIGLFLERFGFRRFTGDFNRTVVFTIAIIVILQTAVNNWATGQVRAIPTFAEGMTNFGIVTITNEKIVIFIVGAILLGFIMWLIMKTRIGLQMQAIAQESEGASLMGINIHRISTFACALGCGLAAVAGSFMGSIFNLSPFMGDLMLLKAIELVILGGVGSITGVLGGGLIIGILDSVLPLFTSGAATQAIGLGVLIIILLLRPQGLFGKRA